MEQLTANPWIAHSKPDISVVDRSAVRRCLARGMVASGPEAQALADEMAKRYGYRYAMCCGSGTQALFLILSAMGIGTANEVILPTYVCHSVADAVVQTGACPVFCDVDENGCIDAESAERLVSEKTRAVIAVHIYGIPCDSKPLEALGLPIVEDFAQRMDCSGRMAGQSVAGFFSFHPTKCLTAGMGGMLACDDESLFRRVQALTENAALFVPLPDMNAALGRSQLARYDDMLERRAVIAQRYLERIPAPWTDGMTRNGGMYYRFCIRKPGVSFERVQACFSNAKIHVRRGVDELLHIRFRTGQSLPVAEKLFAENVSLPIYPALSEEETQRVLQACARL